MTLTKEVAMALPDGYLRVVLVGRWLRPSGAPHRGEVFVTPDPALITALPAGVDYTMVLSTTEMILAGDGSARAEVLNPYDPNISPGASTPFIWKYCVEQHFSNSHWVKYWVTLPEGIADHGVFDLSTAPKEHMNIVRPIGWFPSHKWDSRFSYSGISGTTA
jgi:hypothetical protein